MFSKHRSLLVIFSTLFVFTTSKMAFGQQWTWAINGLGNNQYSDADRDIAVDRNGTQFIAGYFIDTLILGSFKLINPDDYYSDMYLAKMDASGNVIWAKSFELGSTYNESMGICLDDLNNVYITGAIEGSIFVHKYDSDGNLAWQSDIAKKKYYGYGRDISIDQYENVFITGKVGGDAIVAKLNNEGKWQWSSIIQSCHSNGCWGSDIAVDRFGNCYMAGGFDCDSISIGNTIFKRYGTWGANPILVKYTPAGAVSWARCPIGKTGPHTEVALSDKDEVILTGSFVTDRIIFDNITVLQYYSPSSSGFIAKYDSSGGIAWAKNIPVYESWPRDIIVDHNSNIYFGGLSWVNTAMAFHLIKFNANGDTLYTTPIIGGNQYLYGLDIDNFGNSYFTGHSGIKDLGIFGPGYSNPYTVYVAKFNTGAATVRRPANPAIQRMFVLCEGDSTVPLLTAAGSNVKWYSDDSLNHLITNGNSYQPVIHSTDTFYVTQNVNGIESWPKQVIVYFSNLTDFQIQSEGDTLIAPSNPNYTYQWFLDGVALSENDGGKQSAIAANNIGKYKVIINDYGCIKEAGYFYYADKCPGRTASLVSNIQGYYNYSWQLSNNNGMSYQAVSGSEYSGINTDTLIINNVPSSYQAYKYRCVVDWFYNSDTLSIPMQSKWIGGSSNQWENPANWSCGVVPDTYTDIFIETGTVIINSNVTVHSLRINPSVSLIVNAGFKLTISN